MDIAPGRYDDENHPIYFSDYDERAEVFPGIDYWNPRAVDFQPKGCGAKSLSKDASPPFDPAQRPRMGWHDVSIMISGGDMVSDVCRHFIQRWNFTRGKVLPCILPHTQGVVNAGGGDALTVGGILDLENGIGGEEHLVNGQVVRSAYVTCGQKKRER